MIMKKQYFLFLLMFLPAMMSFAQDQPYKLTHEMTPEEELRKHEIGRGFTPTDPPAPPVRMVAEFEEMQSVLIRYPFGIPMSLIVEMSQDCKVKTIVASGSQQQQVLAQYQSAGVNTANCEWLIAPTDSYWTRDYGPWFVVDGSHEVGISDFPYNRPRPNDDNIPVVLSQQMGIPLYGMNMIQTGGNYMCDGLGIGASTDLVIEENPAMSEEEIDTMARDYLGLRKYHLMPDPLGEYIKHIDCWGKFLDVDKVLIGQVPSSDWRYADFEFVANYFAMQTSSWGTPYQVFRVYTPGNYPYTPYTNSLILNKKVFVPQTGSQWDDEALESYEQAMPGYEIVGVMHNTWENTDALHCRAIGIADVGMLYVDHMPLLGNKNFQMSWELEADIIPYSGIGVITDSLLCHYRFDGGTYETTPLELVSGYRYSATIPFALPGTEVEYYLRAADFSGRRRNHPYIGAPDPHKYTVKQATDITILPDSLVFLTVEEMAEGKSFDIYNFTDGDFILNDIEQEGYNLFHWYIDPWSLTLPHTMEFSDTLTLNVKISIPVDNILGGLVVDTLDIYTEIGHRQVVIKVDEDLLSSLSEPNPATSLAWIEDISPNPFNDQTKISFCLEQESQVKMLVYNMQGQIVNILAAQNFTKGRHEIAWDGKDGSGNKVSNGIYLLKMETESGIDFRKLVFSK
jgi:agmatine/peptidylarginine deiminase